MNRYLKNNSNLFALNIILVLLHSFLICFFPYLIDYIVQNYQNFTGEVLLTLVLFLFGAIFLIILVSYFNNITRDKLAYSIKKEIRKEVFEKIICMDNIEFSKNNYEYYVNLQSSELDSFYESYFESEILLCSSLIQAFVFLIAMIFSDWALGLFAAFVSIFCVFIPKLTGKKLDKKRELKIKSNELYLAKLLDLVKGKELVSNSNKGVLNEHNISNENKSFNELEFNRYYSFINIFSDASTYIVLFSVLSCGVLFVFLDISTIGSVLSIYLLITYLSSPLNEILYYLIAIKSSKPYIEDFSNIVKKDYKKLPQKSFSTIKISDLIYKRDKFTLRIDSLTFEKGKRYAIVGKNGIGKSTFVDILMKKIVNYNGYISADFDDYQTIDTHKYISFISQKNYIFNASVKDNITFFNEFPFRLRNKDFEEIDLGLNIEQIVGNQGEYVSGGEKEKISILRTINKKPLFAVFDESFSAIDEASKKRIKKYLFETLTCGIIEITHDVSFENLSRFDEIIVFSKNRSPFRITNLNSESYENIIRELKSKSQFNR